MQEINELKNLVVQSLEANGVLSQLRAQIRSSVFKVVEQQETQNRKPSSFYWENPYCQQIHQTPKGQECLDIIMEFLQFYKMDYTISVFQHEGNFKGDVKKEELSQKFGIKPDSNKPLLMNLLENQNVSQQSNQNNDIKNKQQQVNKNQNIGSSGINSQNNQNQNLSEIQTENLSVSLGSQQAGFNQIKSNQFNGSSTNSQFKPQQSSHQQPTFEQNKQKSQNQNLDDWEDSQVQLMDINPNNIKQLKNQDNDNNDDQVRVSAEDDLDIENITLENNSQKKGQFNNKNPKNKQLFESTDNKSGKINSSQEFELSNEKEKQTLLETKGKLQEIQENLKTGNLGEIPQKKDASKQNSQAQNQQHQQQLTQQLQQQQYDQQGDNYDNDFEQFDDNEQIDELIGDDENQDDNYGQSMDDALKDPNNRNQQIDGQFTASEEFLQASQSQGFDMSVDSVALEEYDYFEDVELEGYD